MGASCGKGYARSVQPESGNASAEEFGHVQVDDSAADCIPAGYMAKRRQAVRPLPVGDSCVASTTESMKLWMTMQVSAEVAAVSLDQPFELKKVHKSTDAEEGIRSAMQYCFLFAGTWHLHFLAIQICRQYVRTNSSGAKRQTGHSLCSKVLAGLQTWKKNRRMMLCTPCSKELWCPMRHSSGKLLSSLLHRLTCCGRHPHSSRQTNMFCNISVAAWVLRTPANFFVHITHRIPYCAADQSSVAALYPQHCVSTGRVSTKRVGTKKRTVQQL